MSSTYDQSSVGIPYFTLAVKNWRNCRVFLVVYSLTYLLRFILSVSSVTVKVSRARASCGSTSVHSTCQPMTCGWKILVGHYLRCGDKHIALISSAIMSSGQTGAEPTKAGRLAGLLLTHLHCLTNALSFAHFHCGNRIRSNHKVPDLTAHNLLGCLLDWSLLALKMSMWIISNDHRLTGISCSWGS